MPFARTCLTTALALALATPSHVAAQDAPDPLPIGTCINIGNTLEPETEGAWGGSAVTAEDFAAIKAAGFTTIRLPVRWYNKSSDTAPYTIDAAWLNRVETVVDQALDAGLNVVLNSHHFEPIYAAPAENADWLAGVWRQVAARFADRPTDRLWFEIENEPHDQLTNANLVATLSPALAAIRETNPDRAVIIGGENWSGVDSLATLELPDDPNIHPTFHYYEPFDFTHQGADWVAPNIPPPGRVYGTQADKDRLVADVAKVEAYKARTGRTPFLGETGAYDAHIPLPQRIAYHRAVTEAFAGTGVPICMWAYQNTFPFRDGESGAWLPGLLGAIGLPDNSDAPVAAVPARTGYADGLPQALRALDDALPGQLVNDPSRLDWNNYNLKAKGYADPLAPGGGAAIQVDVRSNGNPWDAGFAIPLFGKIEAGETVTIGFYAKAAKKTEQGQIGVRFQRDRDPYPGFGDTTLTVGPEWKFHEVSATAERDIPTGEAVVALQVGGQRQSLEIGQAIVVVGAPSVLP